MYQDYTILVTENNLQATADVRAVFLDCDEHAFEEPGWESVLWCARRLRLFWRRTYRTYEEVTGGNNRNEATSGSRQRDAGAHTRLRNRPRTARRTLERRA